MTHRSVKGFVSTLFALERDEESGVLTAQAEGVETLIYFHQGHAVFVEGGARGGQLARRLIDAGTITLEQYAQAVAQIAEGQEQSQDQQLAEVLVKLRMVSKDAIREALTRQVGLNIARCIQWDSFELAFDPKPSRLHGMLMFPTPIAPLVLVGVHRFLDFERMRELLRPYADKYIALDDRPDIVAKDYAMRDDEAALLRQLDGSRTLRRLFEKAPKLEVAYPVFTALELAGELDASDQPRRMRRSDPTPDSSRKRFTFRPEVSWMSVRDAPRRPRNTNRPLFQAASTGASLSDRPQRLKQKVPIEERVQRKSELVAEDAFQQGMRLLGQEQYAEAANLLQQAVATMPQAMEYRLYAAWASYRACRDDEQLRRMRPGLTELAVNTARFERTHPFPPFVRAHMALADGEEAQALALFRDALNRDPANRDAQRHVRLLTSRLK